MQELYDFLCNVLTNLTKRIKRSTGLFSISFRMSQIPTAKYLICLSYNEVTFKVKYFTTEAIS